MSRFVKTHGEGNPPTPEYTTWLRMKARCSAKPGTRFWPHYGAKGIAVCERWIDSFENFLADMGRKPTPRHTIERQNNKLGYEPGNCRWATQKEQTRNYSRNVNIAYQGRTIPLIDWAAELNLSYKRLHNRIHRLGWSAERAFSEPVHNNAGVNNTQKAGEEPPLRASL